MNPLQICNPSIDAFHLLMLKCFADDDEEKFNMQQLQPRSAGDETAEKWPVSVQRVLLRDI